MLFRYAVPSVHRQLGKPNWFCAYTAGGKRYFKSTKSSDKKQAEVICRRWEAAAKKASAGRLTPDAAREVIKQGVKEICAVHGAELPTCTTREWATRWMEAKTRESEPSTVVRYRGIVNQFLAYLSKTADRDLDYVTSTDVEGFRDDVASRLTAASANTCLKVLRSMFSGAVSKEFITRNPASAAFVKAIDKGAVDGRRPLTIAEIKRIYQKADAEWKGMVLMGLYTGQRLGDVSKITWRSVDLENDQIGLTTQKTSKRIILPLAVPLREYFQRLDATDDPDGFIFPLAAGVRSTGHLSNSFRDLLADTGLLTPTSHKRAGHGRNGKRQMNQISFHSLRHSAVTFLKAAGASDVLAREIVGHDSATVSRSYTHLDTEDLRPSINKLPDITA